MRLLWLCAALAHAFSASEGADAACGPSERRVLDRQQGVYRCIPKLERTRDVFKSEKHPKDPCPDGYWWHKRRTDACSPVYCSKDMHQGNIKDICGRGMHPHLNSASDWKNPIICVEDYDPDPRSGGKPRGKGGCEVCTVREHMFKPATWEFARPGGDEKEEKERRRKLRGAGSRRSWVGGGAPDNFEYRDEDPHRPRPNRKRCKKCPVGYRSALRFGGKCEPCSPGAVTVRTENGCNVCVGGEAQARCERGEGLVPTKNPFKPYVCRACGAGKHAWVLDGWTQCLALSCEEGQVAVPKKLGGHVCGEPLEERSHIDWTKVLPPTLRAGKAPKIRAPAAAEEKPPAPGGLEPARKVPLLR